MMRGLTLFPVLLCAVASAQNWALLNPAYKYNYSNDGSDTISNQLFVTHIDTLGVDSFRYELNRITVVCDTCPAEMVCDTCGFWYLQPCDGCFVRLGQQQFLGFDCVRSGQNWQFTGTDTFLVSSAGGIGTTWVFNANTGTTATVDHEWPAELFGAQDTLRRIFLSNGDTVVLSRSFGIVHFVSVTERHDLIGVQGPGVGRVFPDPLAYFDYQPGDVLTYKVYCDYWCWNPGDNPYPQMYFRHSSITITGRSESEDTLSYTTSTALTYTNNNGPMCNVTACPNWIMPTDQWIFTRTDVLNDHPILAAHPGEVLDANICWADWYPGFPPYIANHGISDEGRTIMRSQQLGQHFGMPTSGMAEYAAVTPTLYPFDQESLQNVWYEEGVGLRKVEHIKNIGYHGMSIELVGAIIGGDTIIPPPLINWDVQVPENIVPAWSVHPNPTDDYLVVDGAESGEVEWRIINCSGREASHGKLSPSIAHRIDISNLAPGIYLFTLVTKDGPRAQRFVIAR